MPNLSCNESISSYPAFSFVSRHVQLCNQIPMDIRSKLRSLKGFEDSTDGDTAQYWVDSAKELGLCDYEGGRGEVIFFRDPHQASPADEVDAERKADAPTGTFVVLPEDRKSCTDHIVLLLKQFTPCRFQASDRKGGSIKRRDRPDRFPGFMCTHCQHKRYFPIAEKKVADTTNLMMTHITNCFNSPLPVKASLCYLQHRSLIQKTSLMGNWKITFFKKVWNRLHHQDWGDGIYVPEVKNMDDDDVVPSKPGTDHKIAQPTSKAREDEVRAKEHSGDLGLADTGTFDEDAVANNDVEQMRDLIRSAALWLTEQDLNAEARLRSGRGIGTIQTIRPRSGRGRGRGRGDRRRLGN